MADVLSMQLRQKRIGSSAGCSGRRAGSPALSGGGREGWGKVRFLFLGFESGQIAQFVVDRGDVDFDPVGGSVPVVVEHLGAVLAAFVDRGAEGRDAGLVGGFTLEEMAGLAAGDFAEAVAAEAGESGIDPDDVAGGIGPDARTDEVDEIEDPTFQIDGGKLDPRGRGTQVGEGLVEVGDRTGEIGIDSEFGLENTRLRWVEEAQDVETGGFFLLIFEHQRAMDTIHFYD